jgi:autotransporter translocation and assembly factor TamB
MRVARRIIHVLLIVVTLVVGAAAAAIIVSQTAWFKNWLRGYIVREANQYLNGTLSVGRLGGNLFFGVELENIGVSLDGSQVVAVKDLGIDYSVFELVAKGLSVDNIRLNKPVIYLRREGDTWSISRLLKKQQQEADRSGPGRPIAIDAIGISDGSVVIDGPVGTSGVEIPKRIDHVDAKASFKYEPVRYSIEITHVSFRGSEPAIGLNALSGGVALRNDTLYVEKLALRTEETSLSIDGAVEGYLTNPVLKLQVSSDKLSLPEVARLVPALAGVRLQPAFELKLDGPLDRLGVDMRVRSSAGDAKATLVADVMMPGQSVSGDLSVRHLDLAPILNDPKQKSDMTADAKVSVQAKAFSDLDSLRGTVALNAPRVVAAGYSAEAIKARARIEGRRIDVNAQAAAYGASATAAGRVTLPKPKTKDAAHFDLSGRLAHLDLAKLPRQLNVPPAATDITAAYHASGSAGSSPNVDGDAQFERSTVAGATIAPGSTAGVSIHGKEVGYRADATVNDLDLKRVGEAFRVPALAADRYATSINAHVMAEGQGTTPQEMNVTASGTVTDSSLFGGRIPQLSFDGEVADDTAHVTLTGAFAEFDPAVASATPALKGTVAGNVDLDAMVAGFSSGVTADNVEVTAKVRLEPSTIGGLAISSADVDADYRDSTGVIRTLDIKGRDVNVQATGTLALNERDQSNLMFHADSPSLDELGKLADVPLSGIAKVDGTLTGNRTELVATGTFTGNDFRYAENGALTVTSDYTAKVPNLSWTDANVEATTHGTFVTVAGQNINEVEAKTTYQNQTVEFDATAKQPQRSLTAGGSLLLHPDHQEVHLQRLELDTQGRQWQLAPGSSPTVQYGADSIAVKDVALVSGDQRIAAEGMFGQPDENLQVTLENVDLAAIDALMLRPPQFTGRLNATSTIGGTREMPQVKADFQVAQGGFRQFKYDTLGGSVDYGGKGLNVDAKLQQNPTTWMTAKGYVPTAAFAAAAGKGPRPHREAAAPEDRFDLHVDSSPIDLGIVQGFTTALINARGTLQAKIDVNGAADDPHPNGAITITDGAFDVPTTGVAYSHINGRVDLRPDGVHIDNITVLDNHDSALSISGDLGIHEREVGAFNIYVTGNDFKVVDNKMGNVRIDTNLQIAGDLVNPRVEGDLGVNTGVVNLDPILASVGTSAYATKQTEFVTDASNDQGQTPPPSGFAGLRLNMHVTVPDDLVVRATDLSVPDAPISLGAVNMTLGGDLRVTKEPGGIVSIVGPVRTIRGWYDFQGRRFTLLRDGTIQFVGTWPPDPQLNIKTQRIIQGVTANVNVQGSLSMPQVVLTSMPPLEQADILSLIVFNQPLNQVGEGQQITLTQRAQQMATGQLAGALSRSLGSALNVSEFQIAAGGDNGSAAQLTVGQQVGQHIYVKVEQGIGDQSSTNFVFEYELTDWLRMQSNMLQGTSQPQLFQKMKGSGGDLLFFFSF